MQKYLGLYSLSTKMSYRRISWSLEAVRLDVIMIVSIKNLTDISRVPLPRYVSNFRAIVKVKTQISRLRDFTRFWGKTSFRLVNIDPGKHIGMFSWLVFLTRHTRFIYHCLLCIKRRGSLNMFYFSDLETPTNGLHLKQDITDCESYNNFTEDHITKTQKVCVNKLWPSDVNMHHWVTLTLLPIMASRMLDSKPLFEPMFIVT